MDAPRKVAALNPAAEHILAWSAAEAIGRTAADALRVRPAIMRLLDNPEVSRTELDVRKNDAVRTYDMSVSPLLDPHLTGLFNRRKFFESPAVEIQRARRYNLDLSLIVVDVNGFVILLPSTSLRGASAVAERLLAAVSSATLGFGANVAINMGIAALRQGDDDEGRSLIERADRAMYHAKQAGLGSCTAGEEDR